MRRFLFLILIALFVGRIDAQSIRVDRVDPPNWWVGMEWSRVELLLYGSGLADLEATFEDDRISVDAVLPLASESHAIVRVHIPPDLHPGVYRLELTGSGGATTVEFPIRVRPASRGRYQGFDANDVVYLITPDRFSDGNPANNTVDGLIPNYDRSDPGLRHGGDLAGITSHLDYLKDLGVTVLWLNPVLENNMPVSYHGYAATDLYRVDPRLGTLEEYIELVSEAHRRGLKVIFDHVSNHIGINHPWLSDLPSPDWLNGSRAEHLGWNHNKMAVVDPHGDPATVERLKSFWFTDYMPDLNQRNAGLANYLIQNTLWWIESTGLDGIREDTYVYADQPYLKRWSESILREYPSFNIVGEIWDSPVALQAMFQRGSQLPGAIDTALPTVMDIRLSEVLRNYLRGDGTLNDVYKLLAQDFLYADPSLILTFLDNHDMPRAVFVADENAARVRLALTLLLTTRGIPELLYATEIGMKGGSSHVELRADFPGGFPGDARSAFTTSGRTSSENTYFDLIRKLLHVRKEHPALRTGDVIQYPPPFPTDIYRYLRCDDEETILVILNGKNEPAHVSLDDLSETLSFPLSVRDLLSNDEETLSATSGFEIGPDGYRILQVMNRAARCPVIEQ